MELRRKYIRLFVSSTFADMQIERNALQTIVFPKIQRFCREHGWQFDGIDLRWGVSTEASLDQRTMSICLQELRDCQNVSPRPNFLVLLGERYGWIPLPETLSRAEFSAIYRFAEDSECKLLEDWYLFDSNALPDGEYVLKARRKEYVDYRDEEVYNDMVYKPLHRLMRRYAEKSDDEKVWQRFLTSATEQEIINGALNVPDSREHVIVFERKMTGVPKERQAEYTERSSILDFCRRNAPYTRLKSLKRRLRDSARYVIDRTVAFERYEGEEYAAAFAAEVERVILEIVHNEIDRYEQLSQHVIDRQMAWNIAKQLTRDIVPFGRVLGTGRSYMTFEEWMAAAGTSYYGLFSRGNGRTTYLSDVALRLSKGDADIILRYVRINDGIHSGMSLLRSIWDELNELYPTDKEFSEYAFRDRLATLQVHRPLYILVDDMLDQQICDDISACVWKPDVLPKDVVMVMTCQDIIQLGNTSWAGVNMPERMSYYEFMKYRMALHNRTLTKEQWDAVAEFFEQYGPTLNVNGNTERIRFVPMRLLDSFALLMERYRSYDKVEMPHVIDDAGIRQMFIQRFATAQYSGSIVNYISTLLDMLRFGLSVGEITRLMPMMPQFWADFEKANQHQELCQNVLPVVVAIRALRDLSPLLFINYFHEQYLYAMRINWWRVGTEPSHYIDEMTQEQLRDKLYDFYRQEFNDTMSPHALVEMAHLAAKSPKNWIMLVSISYIINFFALHVEDYVIFYYDAVRRKFTFEGQALDAIRNSRAYFHTIRNYLETSKRLQKKPNSIMLTQEKQDGYTTEEDFRTVVCAMLAAEYAPGTWMRDELDAFMQHKTGKSFLMYNTLGLPSVEHHLISRLPQGIVAEKNRCQFWANDIVWQENVEGNIYFLCPDLDGQRQRLNCSSPRCFCVCQSLLFVVDGELVRVYPPRYLKAACHFNLSLSRAEEICVGATRESGVYIMYAREERKIYRVVLDCNTGKFDFHPYNLTFDNPCSLVGTLNQGEWLVVKQSEPLKDGRYRVVYEVLDMIKGLSVQNYPSAKKTLSPKCYMASTGGNVLAMSMEDRFIYYVNFDEPQPEFHYVFVSMSDGHMPVYYVHVSEDGKTILAISGDKRLMKYTVGAESAEYQMSLYSESSDIVADATNDTVLWDNYDNLDYYNKLIHLKNLSVQHDYFPPSLYSLSASANGETIVASYGFMTQFSGESAFVYQLADGHFTNRLEQDPALDPIMPFTRATAMTADGMLYAYSRGCHIFVVNQNTGKKRHFHFIPPGQQDESAPAHVAAMIFTPDKKALIAVLALRMVGWTYEEQTSHARWMAFDLDDSVRETPAVDMPITGSDEVGAYAIRLSLAADKLYIMGKNWCNTMCEIDLATGQSKVSKFENHLHVAWHPVKGFVEEAGITAYAEDGRKAWIEMRDNQPILRCNNSEFELRDLNPFAMRWAWDCRHLFVLMDEGCILLEFNDDNINAQQMFDNLHSDDENQNLFFSSATNDNIRLYSRGIIYYNGTRILRLEPSGGYRINKTAVARCTRCYDVVHRRYGFPEILCPVCGHRFPAQAELKHKFNCLHCHTELRIKEAKS